MLDDIRMGGVINTEGAKETVNQCVKSVIRHPDALQWMSKMRDENEYTAEHCLNVCILAIAFGRHLGMTEEELHSLGMCGLLHDVGKMKIPPEVLNKPGKLTPLTWLLRIMSVWMAWAILGVWLGQISLAFQKLLLSSMPMMQ